MKKAFALSCAEKSSNANPGKMYAVLVELLNPSVCHVIPAGDHIDTDVYKVTCVYISGFHFNLTAYKIKNPIL